MRKNNERLGEHATKKDRGGTTMSLRCKLFGHDWGEWHSPVYITENDGLDTNVTNGSQRKCSRCNEWDTKVEQ